MHKLHEKFCLTDCTVSSSLEESVALEMVPCPESTITIVKDGNLKEGPLKPPFLLMVRERKSCI